MDNKFGSYNIKITIVASNDIFHQKRASHTSINPNTNFAFPLYSNVKAYISITLTNLTYFSKMYIVHNFRSLAVSGTNVALTS